MLTVSWRIGLDTFLPFTVMELLSAAAVVAVEHHEAGLALVIPHDVAERILGIEIDVVGMAVGPGHGDDELGLGVDLALLGLRIHHQQRDEEQEGDDLQRLEQHHAERIERPFSRG